jgi:UDP-N-acetylglucosamine--dolichyl-phosphate N-acetylglucosaminephosphotransferase
LTFVAINTFYLDAADKNLQILALFSTILISAFIGMVDDILGWKIGLRQWQKPLLTLFAALPMMVVNAGYSSMELPVLGIVDFTYLYPLIIIPIAIAGAANGFNMLGGYNGLETGMGAIILFTLGYVTWFTGQGWVAVIAFCMVFALLALLLFNMYPARIFPGNTLTYTVGALIACIAISGSAEKVALLLFIPYLIQLPLKLRGLMQKESFARVLPDGSLTEPYPKYYAIEHMAISFLKFVKGKAYERDVVLLFLSLESLLSFLVIIIVTFRIGVL